LAMAFERSELKNDFGNPVGEARSCRNESALFDFSFLECPQINHLLPSLFSTLQFSNMRAE